jgi:hypothetical protein
MEKNKPIIDNVVIECLNITQAKKVRYFWHTLGLGINASFESTKAKNCDYRFYGVIDGRFSNFNLHKVESSGARILHISNHKPHYKNMHEDFFPQVGDKVLNPIGNKLLKVVTVSLDGSLVVKNYYGDYYEYHCSDLVFVKAKKRWLIF